MRGADQKLSQRNRQRRWMLQAMAGGAAAAGLGLRCQAKPSAKRDGIFDVAIVGAGLSGLTSARDLQRAGCDSFVVLEARNRVGGRTYNHDLGNGVISEGGGEWIGPGQTAIADLARELGIETFDSYYKGKSVYLTPNGRVEEETGDGGLGLHSKIVGKLDQMAHDVPSGAPWNAPDAAALDRISLGEWLAKEGIGEEESFALGRSTTITFGIPPDRLSLLNYLSVVNSSNCSIEQLESMKGGAQEKRFVGGSQLLSTRMAQALGDKLRLSSPVRRIAGWNREIVELQTDLGPVRARQVIAALSPSLCNRIVFDPPLPEGRVEMQRRWPATTSYRKTVHVYPRPFWRDAGLNGQVMQIEGPLLWCCDNSPPDGSIGVINAFVKPAELPRDPRQAERVLSAIYAQALGKEALHPTQFHDIDWSTVDPWTLSCVSPMPPGFATAWGRFLHSPAGRLIWSSTETADIWAGAMDGAVRAGHRAALQALAALSQTPAG